MNIRIPWQLLNVMDPSTIRIMVDLYKNKGIIPQKVDFSWSRGERKIRGCLYEACNNNSSYHIIFVRI